MIDTTLVFTAALIAATSAGAGYWLGRRASAAHRDRMANVIADLRQAMGGGDDR